jgi:hypothetical protein
MLIPLPSHHHTDQTLLSSLMMRLLFSFFVLALSAPALMAAERVLALCPAVDPGGIEQHQTLFAEGGDRLSLFLVSDDSVPENCEHLFLPEDAGHPVWFSLAFSEDPPPRLGLQGHFDGSSVQVSEIIWEPSAPPANPDARPTSLTDRMDTVPDAGVIVPLADFRGDAAKRAAWIWSPAAWLGDAATVWRIADREQLNRVYITVPVNDLGEVMHAETLSTFIASARQKRLDIWAVIGDPRDVLMENHAALSSRVRAYQRFNQENPDTPLAGLQLDIEPYLLPGFSLDPGHWRVQYLSTINLVHTILDGQMAMDLVMPVWWGNHPDWGNQLLQGLLLPDMSLTVMNYRTNEHSLIAGGEPFLKWGSRHGIPITMALELGSLGEDEMRRNYVATAGRGQLWLLPVGEHFLLVLFDRPSIGMPGHAYVQRNEQRFRMSDITFAGRRHDMDQLITVLLANWADWSSFDGMAIHGLDEFYDKAGTDADDANF